MSETSIHRYQVEKDHGRIEERDCWSVDLPKGLHSDGWKDLASIVMVRSKQTNTEKPSECHYVFEKLDAWYRLIW